MVTGVLGVFCAISLALGKALGQPIHEFIRELHDALMNGGISLLQTYATVVLHHGERSA
eukprot:COSAG06_NODE_3790_length_4901_cov_2.623074_5_plen_59_part_00